jgi:hypothetical protein
LSRIVAYRFTSIAVLMLIGAGDVRDRSRFRL